MTPDLLWQFKGRSNILIYFKVWSDFFAIFLFCCFVCSRGFFLCICFIFFLLKIQILLLFCTFTHFWGLNIHEFFINNERLCIKNTILTDSFLFILVTSWSFSLNILCISFTNVFQPVSSIKCAVSMFYSLLFQFMELGHFHFNSHISLRHVIRWTRLANHTGYNQSVTGCGSQRRQCSYYSTKTPVNSMILILKLNLTSLGNIYIKSGLRWAPHTF